MDTPWREAHTSVMLPRSIQVAILNLCLIQIHKDCDCFQISYYEIQMQKLYNVTHTLPIIVFIIEL